MIPHLEFRWFVLLTLLLSVTIAGWMFYQWQWGDREVFVAGTASHGHHQIIDQCESCHEPWKEASDERCMACHVTHGVEPTDAHAPSILKENSGPSTMEPVLRALQGCRVCHREHRVNETDPVGLTVAETLCQGCHWRVVQRRATHTGMNFRMCTGCHNYHDSGMLTEEFLSRHRGEPALLDAPLLPVRAIGTGTGGRPIPEPDAPSDWLQDTDLVHQWQESVHAPENVNCSDCHLQQTADGREQWIEPVAHETCGTCHARNQSEFLASRHGMRAAVGKDFVKAGQARLDMHPGKADAVMDCNACHQAHDYADRQQAAVESCTACHAGPHIESYADSPHGKLWQAELDGTAPAGSGVSCASCHLPVVAGEEPGTFEVLHDANHNLRPNQKMLTSVCMHCHGARFSLHALADRTQIDENFRRPPRVRDESIRERAESKANP